ncbi:MmcQ/YjbR family DNA-binding protein [Acinetobacter sp. C_4_1]|uniref:MmcQ/YjbR family DNA-binding protein n=1 Tax=unclassified Acinetobacter TaxID=196816 RepID=UPI0021B832D9|nr:MULTISPECIES: MmcQ/YjbR family DNA-binding protein [unclassified Acinetobacter]MCT8090754.1 MmcQ/YjbR family DNA-binding protein [Acinetobacter sp. F_3_1]MCT8099182.1 MmcQ/YjbR family DNA-binding protein [Acinetobacter sp. C_3_1]MCT8102255.1 MmcQ/YjbR family DNA-binding protein [Acinetobacter sp. C_4_1]MCT8136002.1 MmcQ/YjbR family DNA-binding protein [Acinetobacter sp. T_3_1]
MTLHNLASQTALKLPEVTITQPFGDGCDVFKVMDKVFMLSFHLKGQAAINLKVIPDDGAMLRDIYPYIRASWHMNKQHWITVYEDENLDESLVQDLIRNSYELVVSKLNKVQRQRITLLKSAI